ncbi:uncharacterized protein EDB91DRAFT_1338715 [Suillus paluster]|uniref:uncharacterized protein n=1 Tax=Suillus paluster TaxID=48578 RepID=UPI001B86B1FE|nr:uncharacterized protein EDB91DRAFT_1338715 [Suillus paluster]KAG1730989.1 hypothetical protein EDB91DRAFT_1338715 [Suillus paluster]
MKDDSGYRRGLGSNRTASFDLHVLLLSTDFVRVARSPERQRAGQDAPATRTCGLNTTPPDQAAERSQVDTRLFKWYLATSRGSKIRDNGREWTKSEPAHKEPSNNLFLPWGETVVVEDKSARSGQAPDASRRAIQIISVYLAFAEKAIVQDKHEHVKKKRTAMIVHIFIPIYDIEGRCEDLAFCERGKCLVDESGACKQVFVVVGQRYLHCPAQLCHGSQGSLAQSHHKPTSVQAAKALVILPVCPTLSSDDVGAQGRSVRSTSIESSTNGRKDSICLNRISTSRGYNTNRVPRGTMASVFPTSIMPFPLLGNLVWYWVDLILKLGQALYHWRENGSWSGIKKVIYCTVSIPPES